MISPTDLAGLGGTALTLATLSLLSVQKVARSLSGAEKSERALPRSAQENTFFTARLSLLSAFFVLFLLPWARISSLDYLPLAAYVRGVVGDLSLPSLLLFARLAWFALVSPDRKKALFGEKNSAVLVGLILAAAILLYPMALGLTADDPYRWGYASPWFLLALLCLSLLGIRFRQAMLVWAINLSLLAWMLACYESSNLWDYLIDPVLVLCALGSLLQRGLLCARASKRQRLTKKAKQTRHIA
ncbi:MAG: hypothetical protein V4623_07460 [Pseudomonadota bacterium]